MKTLFRRSILIMAITISFISSNVNAKSVFYTNLNGVQMTEYEYQKIVDIASETRAKVITQDEFDKLINADVLKSNTVFQKVTTDIDGNIILLENVSEEEYNNISENLVCENSNRSPSSSYIETSYKRFTASLFDYGNNLYEIFGDLEWKQMPACRSFDVFAFRLKHMSYSNPTAIQTYVIGNNYTNIYYNTSSEGYKSATNGVGFSMNLKDETTITAFDMNISSYLSVNETGYSQAHIFTTYQHAQSSLTRAQSMSYTLSAGGLGDVLHYSNTTIRNKYDDMSGIELTTPI